VRGMSDVDKVLSVGVFFSVHNRQGGADCFLSGRVSADDFAGVAVHLCILTGWKFFNIVRHKEIGEVSSRLRVVLSPPEKF